MPWALEQISVLLVSLAERELGSQLISDGDGILGVVVHGRDLAYFLELTTGQSQIGSQRDTKK